MTFPSSNPLQKAQDLADSASNDVLFRATVTAIDSAQVFIKRLGAASADTQSWPTADGLTLSPGDDVVAAKLGQGVIVLARIAKN